MAIFFQDDFNGTAYDSIDMHTPDVSSGGWGYGVPLYDPGTYNYYLDGAGNLVFNSALATVAALMAAAVGTSYALEMEFTVVNPAIHSSSVSVYLALTSEVLGGAGTESNSQFIGIQYYSGSWLAQGGDASDGTFSATGAPQTLRLEVTPSAVALKVDGVTVGSGTTSPMAQSAFDICRVLLTGNIKLGKVTVSDLAGTPFWQSYVKTTETDA